MSDIATYLPGIIAAYAILMVGASSPGPSVALLVSIATAHGRTPALVTTLGISFGSMSINVLTMLGVGLVLSMAGWGASLLRVIGALYLLYLAYGAFARAIKPADMRAVNSIEQSAAKHFLKGYLLQITNPKAISFWIAIASIGAVDGASLTIISLFVAGSFLISFCCHGAWALALSMESVRQFYFGIRRWVEATLGCLFAFFAYRLGFSE